MISLPVTSTTALCAGIIILLLTVKVMQIRRRDGVVLGDNDSRPLTKAIRGHANAVEQLPIALIILGLAEAQGGSTALLVICAAALVIGRTLHGIYFAFHGTPWQLRMVGMALTLMAQIGVLLALLMMTCAPKTPPNLCRVRPTKGRTNEGTIYGRTDHCDDQGTGSW